MTRLDLNFIRLSGLCRLLLATLALAVLAGCGSYKGDYDKTAGWSADRLYQEAREEISSGKWKEARQLLETLEARYPFGGYAQQALIDQAYVNWKDDEPERALAAIDRFQHQYPNHPGTDYMLYLKGLITFTPPSAAFARLTKQDPSERDPKGLRESYESFNELINRYPDSRYTTDAKRRVAWLVNTIATHEVGVAQYYYERGAYVAAVNRARTVLSDFHGVPAAEKALYIMVLSYDQLGLDDLRDDTRRVMEHNYPNSAYHEKGFEKPVNYWNPRNWF